MPVGADRGVVYVWWWCVYGWGGGGGGGGGGLGWGGGGRALDHISCTCNFSVWYHHVQPFLLVFLPGERPELVFLAEACLILEQFQPVRQIFHLYEDQVRQ